MLRPEWFEHSSELSWAACFTNYAIAFLETYTISWHYASQQIYKQTVFKLKEGWWLSWKTTQVVIVYLVKK